MSELQKLVQKPMRDWLPSEKELFAQRVNELTAQGSIIVMPIDRCAYCGVELSRDVLVVNSLDERQAGLVMPLCDECKLAVSLTSKREYGQTLLNPTSASEGLGKSYL